MSQDNRDKDIDIQQAKEPNRVNIDDLSKSNNYIIDSLLEGNYRFENSDSNWEVITQRFNGLIITIATLIGVGYIIYYCVDTLQNNSTSTEAQKWAQSTLTLIVGAGVGYLTGKQTKS